MKRFPEEFEALLSPAGRRLLKGRHRAMGVLRETPFYASTELLDVKRLPPYVKLLSKTFNELLELSERRLPANDTATQANSDTLPKVGRVHMLTLVTGEKQVERGHDIGLNQMFLSQSFHAFCEALAGEGLDGPQAQVMCYRRGGYAGPHTDHHPAEPRARNGYIDVHLTLATGGVKEQYLVYEHDGHLAEQRSIAANGTVTAYRLPVWHYTTPLITRSKNDCRWLLLGSFFFANTRELPAEPAKRPNKSADFEAAIQKLLLKASAYSGSASSEEPPPPSASAPARQSGDS